MIQRLNFRYILKDLSSNFQKDNSVYQEGIALYESDTNKIKLSDGEHSYTDLPYFMGDGGDRSLLTFKGSVQNYDSLPNDPEIGDVWNVEETGANYAWTGEEWDKLSETVDLSGYLTKDEATAQYATLTLLETKANKATTLSGYNIEDAYNKEEVDTKLDLKTNTSDFNTLEETVSQLNTDVLNIQTNCMNIGNFATAKEAEDKAAQVGLEHPETAIITYQVANLDSGFIINNVIQNTTYQILWYRGLNKKRTITSSNVGEWVSNEDSIYIPNKAISSNIFKLTTDASHDEIIAQMSAAGYQPVTVDDLDKCLSKGFMIQNGVMYGGITVGWTGQAYTLSYIGMRTPKTGLYAMNIIIGYNDGKFSVVKNGTQYEILNPSDLENQPIIKSMQESLSNIDLLKTQISILQDQVQTLKTPSIEDVEIEEGTPTITELDKDIALNNSQIESFVSTVSAKSIQSNNATISSGRLSATATTDITIKNLSTTGELAKSTANAGLSVNASDYITITSSDWQQNGYNGIEVGLNSAPKSILIDGIDFKSEMSNNAISVFAWQDNATITISNCHFASVSNAIRLSNRENKKAVINFINCTCDKWDTGEYAGFIIMQDYTSKSLEEVLSNNQFGKLTLNFTNVYGPNNVKLLGSAEDLYNNHQIYMYNDYEGVVSFDSERFPQITAK